MKQRHVVEATGSEPGDGDRRQLYQEAETVDDLCDIMDEADPAEAYLAAKEEWSELVDNETSKEDFVRDMLPGSAVVYDETEIVVHGVPHRDSDTQLPIEEETVEPAIQEWAERGEKILFEQGLYDQTDFEASNRGDQLEEMYDVQWAVTTHPARVSAYEHEKEVMPEGLREAVEAAAPSISDEAGQNSDKLADLQQHYSTRFLPLDLERAWMESHFPGHNMMYHGRSERMADYAAHEAVQSDYESIHVVVGAKHQPFITEYLEQYAAGDRTVESDFAFCDKQEYDVAEEKLVPF